MHYRLRSRPGSKWAKIVVVDQPDGSFKLRCQCGANCQLANPSQFFKSHTCSEKIPVKGSKGMRALVNYACVHCRCVARLNTNACTAASKTMHNFTPSKNQAEVFNQELLKAIVTSGVSFAFVESSHLVKAAKAVGVELPSRKTMSGGMLDTLFDDTQLATRQSIADMDFPAGASDGWRNKYAQQGDSLMNLTGVGNEGQHQHVCLRFKCSCVLLLFSVPCHGNTALCYRCLTVRRKKSK
jgi:hypothetical protein